MLDGARSDNPALDAALRAVLPLQPQGFDPDLDRFRRLLRKLGDPQDRLPPVFHVSGTNGKGSTIAFLRACLESAGQRVHVYSSPHLVRVNERIRLAGRLIDDAALADLLRDILAFNGEEKLSFFELMTAAAFMAFSRTPADAVLLEVGMGGRLDATNVVSRPVATAITQVGLDHCQWLGNDIRNIAVEKAGIVRRDVPLVLGRHAPQITARITELAGMAGAQLIMRGLDWDVAPGDGQFHYKDQKGALDLPLPRLPGVHQLENAGLALAMLRHQDAVPLPDSAFRAGMGWVEWPARLQKLEHGALGIVLPRATSLWLDGAHNEDAARVIAAEMAHHDGRWVLICAMMNTKNITTFLRPLSRLVDELWAIPLPGGQGHAPADIAQAARAIGIPAHVASGVQDALGTIGAAQSPPAHILIAGSLHLAGDVLKMSGAVPL